MIVIMIVIVIVIIVIIVIVIVIIIVTGNHLIYFLNRLKKINSLYCF